MKVVLATGIYSPEIGGPATYVHALAKELKERGIEVIVVTYGVGSGKWEVGNDGDWKVVRVSKRGGPLSRWWRYAKVLKEHAVDADIVYAFSSVSCGMPLRLAVLKKPKKILRLGGDFLWERYTDGGGMFGLREWYEVGSGKWEVARWLMGKLLRTFDHIIFSTRFQEELYEKHYKSLSSHSVIENAFPSGERILHQRHDPFRMLFMGRFVGFKNLEALIQAVGAQHGSTGLTTSAAPLQLTVVGDGPLRLKVQTAPPVHGAEKQKMFADHDLLILPSLTEISPNAALEARAAGLPVLLTEENGLSEELRKGMVVRPLRTAEEIAKAIDEVIESYDAVARGAAEPPAERSWGKVCEEHIALFHNLL